MSSVFFYEPFYNFDRILDEVLSPNQGTSTNHSQIKKQLPDSNIVRSLKPRMDLHEDTEKNLVTATFEFPGVPKDAIQIEVQNGRLSVSAETKQTSEHNEDGYAVRERHFGRISRVLQLPEGIESDEIVASMEHGVLTINFPKSKPELAPKRIQIF